MKTIKERMLDADVSQVDMILNLKERGITVQPPEMSAILRGVNTYPKANRVLEVCDEILSEIEQRG